MLPQPLFWSQNHDDGDGDGDGDGIKQAISIFLEEKLCENAPLLTVIDNY